METKQWLRLERWLAIMLVIVSVAWMMLHYTDLVTAMTAIWLALGILAIVFGLRAQFKLHH